MIWTAIIKSDEKCSLSESQVYSQSVFYGSNCVDKAWKEASSKFNNNMIVIALIRGRHEVEFVPAFWDYLATFPDEGGEVYANVENTLRRRLIEISFFAGSCQFRRLPAIFLHRYVFIFHLLEFPPPHRRSRDARGDSRPWV